jgi:nickel/cobalt exporter
MDFQDRSAGALLLGTLSIAALHALIPSHWLAFAVVGRAQRWSMRRTLRVTALAGAGHILMTMALGLLIATVGKALWRAIPPQAEHAATAIVLIALGLYFIVPSLRGHGGCHHHHEHDYHLADSEAPAAGRPEATPSPGSRRVLGATRTVMGTLIMGMTLSPCLDLLSLYVAASTRSWSLIFTVCLLMAGVTLSLMVGLVWLTLRGLQRLSLRWLEQNEGFAVGGVLIALGLLLFLWQG